MCLLCEELWMPFELPPEAKARTFVADSPEAAGTADGVGQAQAAGFPSPPRFARDEGNLEAGASSKKEAS